MGLGTYTTDYNCHHDICCQKLPKVVKSCQKLSKVVKSCQKLPKVAKSCQKLPKVANSCQQLPTVTNSCQTLSKVAKIQLGYTRTHAHTHEGTGGLLDARAFFMS